MWLWTTVLALAVGAIVFFMSRRGASSTSKRESNSTPQKTTRVPRDPVGGSQFSSQFSSQCSTAGGRAFVQGPIKNSLALTSCPSIGDKAAAVLKRKGFSNTLELVALWVEIDNEDKFIEKLQDFGVNFVNDTVKQELCLALREKSEALLQY